MKISNQQIQFDRAAKTASLTHKDKARETLQKIAADLVSDKGAIKSGYLRISASGNEVDVKAGFMGSGANSSHPPRSRDGAGRLWRPGAQGARSLPCQ